MTRVVLDGLPLVVRSAGVATYTRELVRHLAAAAPGVSFELFAPRRWRDRAAAAPAGGAGPRGAAGAIQSWRYPLVMGPLLAGWATLESVVGEIDLFHGTTYTLPARSRAPLVATVHDLALLRHPELGNRRLRAMVQAAVAGLARASRIIAVSRATRDDLVELCGIDAARIDVVYNGCPPHLLAPGDPPAESGSDRAGGEPGPYVLHVGTLEPRKNLPMLIRAFARVRREGALPHALVLAGDAGWGGDATRRSLAAVAEHAGVAGAVRFTGRVDDARLRELYAGADLFVYPSLYEGFGLPVLEAMASGVPVVTSNVAALPEIAGDAALLVEPRSEASVAAAIRIGLLDAERAAALRAAGRRRAAQFTWSATARATLDTYSRCLGREIA